MALTTITNGTSADADEVMENFNSSKIIEIYTGSGFDASRTFAADGSGTTQTQHELTAVTPAQIINADYVIIHTTVAMSGYQGTTYLEFEIKEVGGSYSSPIQFNYFDGNSGSKRNDSTFTWVHTLTAGQKTNGFQIRLTGNANVDANSETANIANRIVITKLEV